MSPLRIGIIGVGTIANTHLRDYQNCPDTEVIALADINPEALQRASKEYGINTTFTDYRDLLSFPEVDAVSICTPPFLHCEMVVAAAHAKKHILCEKPMAMNAGEASQMVAAAGEASVILSVCHGRARFWAPVIAAKKLVDQGELGEVYYARFSSYRRRGRPGIDILKQSPWFTDRSKAGGGAINDMICYDLDAALYLMGSPDPVSVSAFTFRGIGDAPPAAQIHDVEEHASLMVRFKNGASAQFEHAWASNMDYGDGARLFGTKGGIRFNPFTFFTHRNSEPWDVSLPVPERGISNLPSDFARACLQNSVPVSHAEDALKVAKIIDAAYRSAQSGREAMID